MTEPPRYPQLTFLLSLPTQELMGLSQEDLSSHLSSTINPILTSVKNVVLAGLTSEGRVSSLRTVVFLKLPLEVTY